MAHTHTEEVLNSLLRGELAATETYQQAMAKVHAEPDAADLRQIHVDHRTAANELRKYVHTVGGQPDHGSGTWGAFAKAVEGTASLLGNSSALHALKEGELHGLKEYRDALNEPTLPETAREFIRSQLLPQTEQHIRVLERLLNAK
ncbi:MAG: DUF2383 domain-containing protein [Gemmataceae bacterium]